MRDFSRTVLLMISKGFANQLSQMVFWNLFLIEVLALCPYYSIFIQLGQHQMTITFMNDNAAHRQGTVFSITSAVRLCKQKDMNSIRDPHPLKGFHVCE